MCKERSEKQYIPIAEAIKVLEASFWKQNQLKLLYREKPYAAISYVGNACVVHAVKLP